MNKTMDDHWVILARGGCSWCDKALVLLHKEGLYPAYFNIDQDFVLKEFLLNSGKTTVPQVFLNGNLIGGYDDLEDYLLYVVTPAEVSSMKEGMYKSIEEKQSITSTTNKAEG